MWLKTTAGHLDSCVHLEGDFSSSHDEFSLRTHKSSWESAWKNGSSAQNRFVCRYCRFDLWRFSRRDWEIFIKRASNSFVSNQHLKSKQHYFSIVFISFLYFSETLLLLFQVFVLCSRKFLTPGSFEKNCCRWPRQLGRRGDVSCDLMGLAISNHWNKRRFFAIKSRDQSNPIQAACQLFVICSWLPIKSIQDAISQSLHFAAIKIQFKLLVKKCCWKLPWLFCGYHPFDANDRPWCFLRCWRIDQGDMSGKWKQKQQTKIEQKNVFQFFPYQTMSDVDFMPGMIVSTSW